MPASLAARTLARRPHPAPPVPVLPQPVLAVPVLAVPVPDPSGRTPTALRLAVWIPAARIRAGTGPESPALRAALGRELPGRAATAQEVLVQQETGSIGSDQTTAGLTGPGLTGPGLTGPGLTGPGLTGPGLTGPGRTGTGLGRAGPAMPARWRRVRWRRVRWRRVRRPRIRVPALGLALRPLGRFLAGNAGLSPRRTLAGPAKAAGTLARCRAADRPDPHCLAACRSLSSPESSAQQASPRP
jgi:hypothetical protein